MSTALLPTSAEIWRWLEDVPDPEIPVLSVVDLGIIRDVTADASGVRVTITPTYSGCPAMAVIERSIESVIRGHGIDQVTLATQLAPAWTTDWISAEGKRKLKNYGIAPPVGEAAKASPFGHHCTAPALIACPRCNSTETIVISQFGSTPCKALYRCQTCLEPFDYFKCH